MNKAELLKKLGRAEKRLRNASVWNSTKNPVSTEEAPYLFEFLCFLELCLNLEKCCDLEIVQRKEKKIDVTRWPKSPALKKNYSYAKISHKKQALKLDLNPGIRITDQDGKDRAPDFSITQPTGDQTPLASEVLEIWDAKYSSKDGPLSDKEVSDFLFTAQQLGFPRAPSALVQSLAAKEFKRSGIITNVQESTEPVAVFRKHQLQEVSGFPDAVFTRP